MIIWSTVSHFLRSSFDWENQTRLELVKCKSARGTCLQVIRRHSLLLRAVIKYLVSWESWPSKEGDVIMVIYVQIWATRRRHVAETLSSGFWKICIHILGEAMHETSSLWLQLALKFVTQHGPWEEGSWSSVLLISQWWQMLSVVALPGTVLAGVKSLFSCPLPFPFFHPGPLPAEIEPVQTDPWPRPAACSGCLPRGAAGPHYEAAVSITKKEKSQLSMELRTRIFASLRMQVGNA